MYSNGAKQAAAHRPATKLVAIDGKALLSEFFPDVSAFIELVVVVHVP